MESPGVLRASLAASVVLVAGLVLVRVWIVARRHSGGGKPISGLPIAFAYMQSLAVALITLVLLVAILAPWESLGGE